MVPQTGAFSMVHMHEVEVDVGTAVVVVMVVVVVVMVEVVVAAEIVMNGSLSFKSASPQKPTHRQKCCLVNR